LRTTIAPIDDPLPADANLGRQGFLVEAELHPAVAYDGPQVDRCSNPHAASQMSAFDDIVAMSAIGDLSECQRSTTRRIAESAPESGEHSYVFR
jgi:hypothetical protein